MIYPQYSFQGARIGVVGWGGAVAAATECVIYPQYSLQDARIGVVGWGCAVAVATDECRYHGAAARVALGALPVFSQPGRLDQQLWLCACVCVCVCVCLCVTCVYSCALYLCLVNLGGN